MAKRKMNKAQRDKAYDVETDNFCDRPAELWGSEDERDFWYDVFGYLMRKMIG